MLTRALAVALLVLLSGTARAGRSVFGGGGSGIPLNHTIVDGPQLPTATKGLQEAVDTTPDGGVIEVRKGIYFITKACSDWVSASSVGVRQSGNFIAGGGAIQINHRHNLRITCPDGPEATQIIWETEFSISSCNVVSSPGSVASVFRIDSGWTASGQSSTGVTIENCGIKITQTNLSLTLANTVGISAVDIGPQGTVEDIALRGNHIECRQKRQLGRCVSIAPDLATAQQAPEDIVLEKNHIRASPFGVFALNVETMDARDNTLKNVDAIGYGCAPVLFYKMNGALDFQSNRLEYEGTAGNCTDGDPATPIRWIQVDGRNNGADGFPGTGITVLGNQFIIAGQPFAAEVFEGGYITGYSGVDFSHNKFWCTVDYIDSLGAGDGVVDHCKMIVLQIDSTNTGAGRVCDAVTPCNEAFNFTHNLLIGFVDDTDAGVCPIQIQIPADPEDNSYGIFAMNTCFLRDATGARDTGPLANCFCGGADPTMPYGKKNLIFGNVIVGKPEQCMAGQGTQPCAVSFDLATQSLTPTVRTYHITDLPSATTTGPDHRALLVDDGTSETDCTAGGGTHLNWCVDCGSVWCNP